MTRTGGVSATAPTDSGRNTPTRGKTLSSSSSYASVASESQRYFEWKTQREGASSVVTHMNQYEDDALLAVPTPTLPPTPLPFDSRNHNSAAAAATTTTAAAAAAATTTPTDGSATATRPLQAVPSLPNVTVEKPLFSSASYQFAHAPAKTPEGQKGLRPVSSSYSNRSSAAASTVYVLAPSRADVVDTQSGVSTIGIYSDVEIVFTVENQTDVVRYALVLCLFVCLLTAAMWDHWARIHPGKFTSDARRLAFDNVSGFSEVTVCVMIDGRKLGDHSFVPQTSRRWHALSPLGEIQLSVNVIAH